MDMNSNACDKTRIGRREFLSGLSKVVTASALVLGSSSIGKGSSTAEPLPPASPLPTIRLGQHSITRLIVGSNPISGYSYMGPILDQQMKEYFTLEQTTEFLWKCEKAGINTHQFSNPEMMTGVIRTLRERGSKMKFICLHSSGPDQTSVKQIAQDTAPIAIVHHGGVTDRLFREGKSQQVHDFVKRVHDAGVLAGISAHNPDCIKQVADEGWEVDLFMTCFYNLTRTPEEMKKMPAVVTLQIGYPFFASDPVEMSKVVRQVKQPCLGFKILAAGRMCSSDQQVEAAFKFAFENIKPTDGVIVGMFPRYRDQINQNVQYTRQFGMCKGTA